MVETLRRFIGGALLAAAAAAATSVSTAAQTPAVKITDPTSVVMIVNRDSNEIAFMDTKTKGMVGKVFLDRKSTRLNSSHIQKSRMPSSA